MGTPSEEGNLLPLRDSQGYIGFVIVFPLCEKALTLDRQDPLAGFRERFVVSDPNLIYLDGNSLGRMPREAAAVIERVGREWGERLVRGWGEGWYELPRRLGAKLGGLIGAKENEVLIADSTSVDLYKLVMAGLALRPGRTKIVTETANFPSDLYLLQGIAGLTGHEIVRVSSSDGLTLPPETVEALLDGNTALLTLSHASFKSGFVHDMKRLTEAAHRVGALVLWDLSHSVGAMPIFLNECGVDLAVGCTYKYLNGGPGAPAFLYVREDLQEKLVSPICGWFGQRDPFNFELDYQPAAGISRFLAGTPPILSMAAIEPGLDLLIEAGLDAVRAKSVLMTEFLVELYDHLLASLGVSLNSPRDARQRGSHVSFGHPEGLRIDLALIERMNVVPDFRYPDNIRYGASPLYTSFIELYQGVDRLARVVREKIYEEFPLGKVTVT